MAWRRPGDKPLLEPMMVRLPTHICVARPQCVNITSLYEFIFTMILHFPCSYYSTAEERADWLKTLKNVIEENRKKRSSFEIRKPSLSSIDFKVSRYWREISNGWKVFRWTPEFKDAGENMILLQRHMTWALWFLKSLTTWLLVQKLVQSNYKVTPKFCITGSLWREFNSPVTGGFPTQRASNVKSDSTLGCHHKIR